MIKSISKVTSIGSLKKKLTGYRRQGKTVIFTNGCFDILHWGHASYLEAAKKDEKRILVVGLNSDASVRLLNKGTDRPIIPQKERALLLASLACVDHVVIFNEPTPYALIGALLPDVLVKGSDWKGKDVAGADIIKENGGKVEFIKYINGFSTTNIVSKIRRVC